MDKTTSISLGGYAFILDNSAFIYLKDYLEQIRKSLGNTEGVEEILADVEARIAELLKGKLASREVAGNQDILAIIEQMGKPEDYREEDDLEPTTGRPFSQTDFSLNSGRKLFRDISDAWIGGVCSGIARYLNIDAIWVRLLFVAIAFLDIFTIFRISTGFVVITYIVMWVIIPEAQSTTDKLQMQGRPVNLDSIKEFAESTASNVSKAANQVSPRAGGALRTIGKILLVVLGIWLALQGFALIIGGLTAFVVFTSGLIPPSEYLQMVIGWDSVLYLGFALAALAIIIPGVLLLILAFRIFSERYRVRARYVWSLVALWFVAVIGTATIAITKSKDFWHEGSTKEFVVLPTTSDTLAISFNRFKVKDNDNKKRWIEQNDHLFELDGTIYHRNVDLSIHPTNASEVSIEIKYIAQGSSTEDARQNTKNTSYDYKLSGNRLQLNDYLKLVGDKRFKGQRVDIRLNVPENITILSENMERLNFAPGDNNDWYNSTKRDAKGNYYRFINGEVKCVSCIADCEDCDEDEIRPDSKKTWKITSDDGVETRIEVSEEEGLRIENEANKVILNKDSIYIKDDSDSVRVNINSN